MNEEEGSLSRSGRKATGSPKATTASKGKAVIVLGMHRSGTSALARVLNMLGCSLPANLMGATVHNPTGHWESNRVMELNDDLLSAAGSAWDDWLPLAGELKDLSHWDDFVARGQAVLKEEFGNAAIRILKDPRICRLAPFWFEVLRRENVQAAVVFPLRHPLEVAQSLATRDNMDEGLGILLWLRYVLDAESASRGAGRAFVTYVDLLNDWEGVADTISDKTGIILPRRSALTALDIEQFITPDLRHHGGTEANRKAKLPPWADTVYDILLRWAKDGEDASDYPVIDAIAAQLGEATVNFARPLLATRSLRPQLAEHRAALVQAHAERDALVTAHDEAVAMRDHVSLLHSEISARLDEAAHAHEVAIGDLKSAIEDQEKLMQLKDQASSRVEEIEKQLLELTVQREAEQRLFSEKITALEIAHGETSTHAAALEEEVLQLRTLESAREKSFSDTISTVEATRDEALNRAAALQEELSQIRADIIEQQKDLTDQLSKLQAERDEALFRARTLEEDVDSLRTEASSHEDQLSALAASLEEATDHGQRLEGELSRLRSQTALWEKERLDQNMKREAERRQSASREAELQDELFNFRNMLRQKEEQLSQLESDFETLRTEYAGNTSAMQKEINRINRQYQNRCDDLTIAKSDQKRRFDEISILTNIVLKAQENYREILEKNNILQYENDDLNAQIIVHLENENKISLINELIDQKTELVNRKEADLAHAVKKLDGEKQKSFMVSEQLDRLNVEYKHHLDQAAVMRHDVEWLRHVSLILSTVPWWWRLAPKKMAQKWQLSRLKRRNLFDADGYFERYPDVAQSGMSPLQHYLLHGIDENRTR